MRSEEMRQQLERLHDYIENGTVQHHQFISQNFDVDALDDLELYLDDFFTELKDEDEF